MTDMMQTGAAWLQAQRAAHMTRTVTYRRGELSVEVAATLGQTVFRLDRTPAASVRLVTRDYIISAGILILDGQTVLPERGDRIEESDGQVCEVLPPGGEPEWRWHDRERTVFRIHTKEVTSGS